jgi:hypothetical protein
MQNKDPKPEIQRLEELAIQVRDGEIKLPMFQRPFVWRPSDMLNLLDSIYKGYPIGSLLLWNSSQRLSSERHIQGLSVNKENSQFFPTNYLLDGQQRLTTLCGALFWEGNDPSSIWNIHFDLNSETFFHPKSAIQIHQFPLNKLIKTSDFIKQCMKFEHHAKKEEYFTIAERLLKSLKDYKIAVVKIGDMTIEEVAPIFERINSTGRKLTMVDLMMAATWSDGFDLNAEIKRIKEIANEIGFQDISDQIILRSISAAAELGINKEDIQKLRTKKPDQLKIACQHTQASFEAALRFIKEELNIHDFGYIPYAFQLTYLAEFFRINPQPGDNLLDHLKKWFWFTSVTRYFGTSNTGQVSKDLLTIRNYAENKINKLFDSDEIDISKLLFDKFNLRNATSTTFSILLGDMNPDRTITGEYLDQSYRHIKNGQLYSSFCPYGNDLEKLNIAKVIYPDKDITGNIHDQDDGLLAKHLLDIACIDAIKNHKPHEFIKNRGDIISRKISELTGCIVNYTSEYSSIENTATDDTDEDSQ